MCATEPSGGDTAPSRRTGCQTVGVRMRRQPLFYGWWIVAISFIVNAVAWSTRASFAVIYAAMLHDLGWSRSEAVLGYALSWLLLVGFGPLSGWLFDRLGPRVVVAAGGAALALGLALTSRVHAPWQYYLTYGPLVAFGIGATLSPSSALLSRWFVHRRGTALGIMAAGSSLGTVVSLPVVAALVTAAGWRAALVWHSLVVLLVLVPLPALFYRSDPQALGLVPDGTSGIPPSAVRITSERAWRVRDAVHTPAFWAAFLMLLLGVVAFQVLTTHQVAYAADQGIDPAQAALIFGLAGIYQLVGNLLGGTLSDWWGRQRIFLTGSLVGLVAVVALASVRGPQDLWKLHLFALALGIGFGARIALLSAIPADAFGGPRFGLILGLLGAGSGLGGFIGPLLGGLIFDLSGSYLVAFVAAGGAVMLSGVAAWFARPPARIAAEQPTPA